jgi:hypothetical protein
MNPEQGGHPEGAEKFSVDSANQDAGRIQDRELAHLGAIAENAYRNKVAKLQTRLDEAGLPRVDQPVIDKKSDQVGQEMMDYYGDHAYHERTTVNGIDISVVWIGSSSMYIDQETEIDPQYYKGGGEFNIMIQKEGGAPEYIDLDQDLKNAKKCYDLAVELARHGLPTSKILEAIKESM